MLNTESFTWTSYARTDVGKIRKINEDSCFDNGKAGLWVVADGMGGHAAGDVASSAITQSLSRIEPTDDANMLVSETEKRLIDINADLIRQASERDDRQTMGSTVVVLLAFREHCITAWVGDSRIYRIRDGRLKRLTSDHSKVQDFVDEGLLSEADAETHPEANIITRAVGANQNLYVDLDIHDVYSGDRFLLCSDGLYKEVSEQEIQDILSFGSPEQACNSLIELTLERGSRDNVSVIVVQADKEEDITETDKEEDITEEDQAKQ